MSDPYRRVSRGDPLRLHHVPWNRMLGIASGADKANTRGAPPVDISRSGELVSVRNDSAETFRRYEAVSLVTTLIEPTSYPTVAESDTDSEQTAEFLSRVVMSVAPLSWAAGARNDIAILADPLAPGEMGRAWVSGVCPVRVWVDAETRGVGRYVSPVPDRALLGVTRLRTDPRGNTGALKVLYDHLLPDSSHTEEKETWAVVSFQTEPWPELEILEVKSTLREGDSNFPEDDNYVEYNAWVFDTHHRDGENRRGAEVPVNTDILLYDEDGNVRNWMPTPFRGVAFGADDVVSGEAVGDLVLAVRLETGYSVVSGGRVHCIGSVTGGEGVDAGEYFTALVEDNPSNDANDASEQTEFGSRSWNVEAYALVRLRSGETVILDWDSANLRWNAAPLPAVRTLYEVTADLIEGGTAATAYALDDAGARTGSAVSVEPSPYETGSALVGPFRGVAFAATGTGSGQRGDVVEAMFVGETLIALGSGRTAITGTASNDAAPGGTVRVAVDTADSRTIEASGTALCAITAGDRVKGDWNGPEQRWDVVKACPAGEDEEEPDPDDPENPPDGGGGGPGDAACYPCSGMPPRVDCSPLNCCPQDDESLTVTDCEEFAAAPEEYYVEVPPLNCVPNCATGNEPDETSGLPPGRVVLTHVAGTCTWESEVFTCDGHDWYWGLDASLDGRSWLRLYRDDVVILQWQTSDAWCPRCDNPVTIYCPPDECTDLTAKLCVKPVCANCADATCYTVDNPADWMGIASEEFLWNANGNPLGGEQSGSAVTDTADGRPNPPSRKITLVYGTASGDVDGAMVVETFPGIEFDPDTCAVDLDGVCGIELSVKVQSDDSVGDRGVQVGIAIKQGADSFVARIGTVRRGEGWRAFEVGRLLAADFDEVTSTGLDDASHPDWTAATGTAMTFGVALWQEDGEVDDRLEGPITVVANWDLLRLCLDHEPCDGDPAAYACPEAVSIIACEQSGATATGTIAFTNEGDSPLTIVSVGGAAAIELACGGTVTVDTAGFLGPLGAGDTRSITITVDRTTPVDCGGSLTITTNLAGAEVCVVPVTVVVLATGECDPPEEEADICDGELHEDFDDLNDYDGVLLTHASYEIVPRAAGCEWQPALSQMMDVATGDAETMTSGYGWMIASGTAQPAINSVAAGSDGDWPSGRKIMLQELGGFEAAFGNSYLLLGEMFFQNSGSYWGGEVGLYLFKDARNHFSIRRAYNSPMTARLVSVIGGVETVHANVTSIAAAELYFALWRVGNRIEVVGNSNSDLWANPGTNGAHVFDRVDIPAGFDKLAIGVTTMTGFGNDTNWPNASFHYLCATSQQGASPPWEA